MRVTRMCQPRTEAMKEKYVGKKIDQLEQSYGNIRRDHADDDGKSCNWQYSPGGGEVSESFDWSSEVSCGSGWCCRGRFVHGPAFLIPPVRGLGATVVSFTEWLSPVNR